MTNYEHYGNWNALIAAYTQALAGSKDFPLGSFAEAEYKAVMPSWLKVSTILWNPTAKTARTIDYVKKFGDRVDMRFTDETVIRSYTIEEIIDQWRPVNIIYEELT